MRGTGSNFLIRRVCFVMLPVVLGTVCMHLVPSFLVSGVFGVPLVDGLLHALRGGNVVQHCVCVRVCVCVCVYVCVCVEEEE
jgi:hypothetical protein